MNRSTLHRLVARSFAAVGCATAVLAGDLTPPAGPVASTMKPLSQVEPRIAINATNTPGNANCVYRIAQPGSYYLTGNVSGVAGKAGIEIASDDVTIDLQGMTMRGVPGSFDGIATSGEVTNVRITNGVLRGWGARGVYLEGFGAILSDLRVSNNGSGILAADDALVQNCLAHSNFGPGINVTGTSAVVRGCTARNNNGVGIHVSSNSVVEHCATTDNNGGGISAAGGVTISHCTATQNGAYGIVVESYSSIANCVATVNTSDGIRVNSQCRVTDNTSETNGVFAVPGAGIRVLGTNNRIEANTVVFNDAGIQVDVAGNFIVRNSASENGGANYAITGTQTIGPIISATGTIATNNPWANFEF